MARLTLSASTKIVRRGTATPRNLELLQVMRELDEIRRSPYYSGPGAADTVSHLNLETGEIRWK